MAQVRRYRELVPNLGQHIPADEPGVFNEYFDEEGLPDNHILTNALTREHPFTNTPAKTFWWAINRNDHNNLIGQAPNLFFPRVMVDCLVRNHTGDEIETRPGALVYASFRNAFELARRRYMLRAESLDDGSPWVAAYGPALKRINYLRSVVSVEFGPTPEYNYRDHGIPTEHNGDGFQMVVRGIKLARDKTIGPDGQDVFFDNPAATVARFDHALRHFFENANPNQDGSPQLLRFIAQPRDIIVRYTFNFVFQNPPMNQTMAQLAAVRWRIGNPVAPALFPLMYGPWINQNAAPVAADAPHQEEQNVGQIEPEDDPEEEFDPVDYPPPPPVNRIVTRRVAQVEGLRSQLARFNGLRVTRRTGAEIAALQARLAAINGGNNVGGSTYVRACSSDIFTMSKACISVPFTTDELCFPMAFMRCQMRTWDRTGGEMKECRENERIEMPLDEDPPDFGVKLPFLQGKVITLFHNSKERVWGRGNHRIYSNEATDMSEEEIQVWHWCACQIHLYVESAVGMEVEVNNLERCLHAYSFVFDVNISVFAIEQKGARIHMVKTLGVEAAVENSFVGMLLQNGHLHAISDMREYQRSGFSEKSSCKHTYCDYCNKMSFTWTKNFAHHNKCSRGDWGGICSLTDMHMADVEKYDSVTKFRALPKKIVQPVCTNCASPQMECKCPVTDISDQICVQCTTCNRKCAKFYFNRHVCKMWPKEEKGKIPDDKIYVWDIEAQQNNNAEIHQAVHELNYSNLRSYATPEWNMDFYSVDDFILYLITEPAMKGTTIVAHNGGGYDYQFVVRFLEENNVMHKVVPRPGTLHKYLMVEIEMGNEKDNVRFIDSMMLIPGSLSSIGESLGLDVCKGDFPHRFSRTEHQNYVGRLPPLDHAEDWYNFDGAKDEKALKKSKKYWTEQAEIYCGCDANHHFRCSSDGYCQGGKAGCDASPECLACCKPLWDFKKQLKSYCQQDTLVLVGVLRKYREEALRFVGESEYGWAVKGIDPLHYMTQGQVAINIYLQGLTGYQLTVCDKAPRATFHPEQIMWMEDLMKENPKYKIQHAGNSFKEWYDTFSYAYVDGYCDQTKEVFEYFDCKMDGCPLCNEGDIVNKRFHEERQTTWDVVHRHTQDRIGKHHRNNAYRKVNVMWSCQFMKVPTGREIACSKLMSMRDCFYGGRTEVFAAYADVNAMEDKKIIHDDVCSEYPYVCAFKDLPIGVPEIIYDRAIDKARLDPKHPNRY